MTALPASSPLPPPAPSAGAPVPAPGWGPVEVLAGVGAALLVALLALHPRGEGDTGVLLQNADGLLRCLSGGRAWGRCPEGGQWAPLQSLVAVPLRALGVPPPRVLWVLSQVSLVAFVGLLAVTWRTLAPRSRPVAAAAVLVLGSGPLLHYSSSSFGEMLATFLTAAFAASWLAGRGPLVVGALVLGAALSKETAFPFLALLGGVCVACRRGLAPPWARGWRQVLAEERARLWGAGVGLLAGVAASVALNLYRFGVPYSAPYVRLRAWAPAPLVRLEFFGALWGAPNVGVLFFWPLLALLLGALAWTVVRRRRAGGPVDVLPGAGVALLLVGTSALLANWWAPFGWWAWGGRLLLPWLPVALLVLLFAYAEMAGALVRPLVATRLRTAALALLLGALAAPHLLTVPFHRELVEYHFVSSGICPLPDPPHRAPAYYGCVRFLAWSKESPLLRGWGLLAGGQGWAWVGLLAAVLALGCAWLHRAGRGAVSARPSADGTEEGAPGSGAAEAGPGEGEAGMRGSGRERWAAVGAAAAGLAWFVWSGGGPVLVPTATDWTMVGDWSTHQLGWLFYRRAPWQLPLGGLPHLLYPVGTSVGFTDSMPWVALVGKVLSGLLPVDVQYIGPWLGLSFALQGYWGARLVALASPRPLHQVLGGALFALTPVLLHRLAHDSLTAHWVLLALMWAHLRPVTRGAGARRLAGLSLGLVTFTAGVHPYLMTMVLALGLALLVRLGRERRLSWGEVAGWAVAMPTAALGVLALHGYFVGGVSAGTGGFGTFSADVAALVNPMGWSRWLRPLPLAHGAYEGFGYLGLGVLALAACAGVLVGARPQLARALPWGRALPLAVTSGALALFALSSQVKVAGQTVLDLQALYRPVLWAVEPFRSSGRFIWPLHYLVLAFAVLGTLRALRARAGLGTLALGAALAVQLADVDPTSAQRVLASRPFRRPDLAAWESARGPFAHLALLPPQVFDGCPYGFDAGATARFAYLAYRLGMTFNSGYVARLAQPATREACQEAVARALRGELSPDTLYLPLQGQAQVLAQRGARCGVVDGVEVCVAASARGPFVEQLRARR